MRAVISSAMMALGPTLMATAAFAQAPVAPFFTWTGYYAGLHAGVVSLRSSVSVSNSLIVNLKGTDNAAMVGFQGGYNRQFGSLVIGAETDFAFTNADSYARSTTRFAQTYSGGLTALGTTRARAGFATGNALFFLTAGLAYGSVSSTFYDSDAYFASTGGKWKIGAAFGGGVEYAVAPNLSFKADVLYFDLGRITSTACNGNDCGKGVANIRSRNKGVVVRTGLNYRFGFPAAPALAQY